MSKKTLIWGGGSKAKLAIELFNLKNVIIFDPYIKKFNSTKKVTFFNKFKDLKKVIKTCSKFFVCIGNNHGEDRKTIAEILIKNKLKPISLIHKKSIIHKSVNLGKMIMIMPGSVINPNVKIKDYVVINTSAVIEHDCILGHGVEVMGSASIAGNCIIEKNSTIGTNATIFPYILLKENSYVGAGSVIRNTVGKNNIVVGNPGKFLKKNEPSKNKIKKTISELKKI